MNAAARRLMVVAALAAATAGAEQPRVQISMSPQAVAVGESAQLRVTVLVPTWLTSPPDYPSFELPNAITRLPPDSSFPTSERVGTETWSGVIRNYRVYPLSAARYRFADQTMTVRYADPNTSRPVTAEVALPSVELRASVPDGAAGLDPYLAGSALTLTREIEGDVGSLAAGDAVVLRYTARLRGLPSLFLPPLFSDPDVPGLAVYVEEPVVEDGAEATRSEKVTLVFEAGGQFVIPELRLDWWDSRQEKMRTAAVDALTLSVSGPALASDRPPADRETPAIELRLILPLAVLVLVVAVAAPRLARRSAAARRRRRESESHAYRQLRSSLASGSERAAHDALRRWLDKAGAGPSLRAFADRYGDADLRQGLDQLSRNLFHGGTGPIDANGLAAGIDAARNAWLRESREPTRAALPALNPSSTAAGGP